MKWVNKTNEKLYVSSINKKDTKFCIYGAGILGGDLYNLLKHYGMFSCFIDNNEKIQEKGFNNEKVFSENEFFESGKKDLIIIAATEENTNKIKSNLENRGLKCDEHFFTYEYFLEKVLPLIIYDLYDQIFLNLCQICVTERCTLKCKKCAHGCYAVGRDNPDLTLEQVKKSADVFFSKVDYIHEFVLIGGEPMLYSYLGQAIEYIGKNYRDKINIFSITTNGTIFPSDELLNMCKQYNVLFRVSNYSNAISKLEVQYVKLENIFKNNNVKYRIGKKEKNWMDYGFDYYKRDCSDEELIEVFDACHTSCHEIRENKFYYCVMARSVSDNLNFNVGKDDYLDFNQLTGKNWRRELLEYILGYSEKGYLDMCRYCHGADCYNYLIPAAQQL
jgi:hypothetical protein